MATSSDPLRERALDLAWSLWTELGVPGVLRRHSDWSIDPEALILFTAWAAQWDPRLRDESIAWCVANHRCVSLIRLRALVGAQVPAAVGAFEQFAGAVAADAPVKWAAPGESRLTSRARRPIPDLSRPALVRLRLRAVFGVTARAEILHAFLASPCRPFAASRMAAVAGFGKRSVQVELEELTRAGVLGRTTEQNRHEYTLARSGALGALLGAPPAHFLDWSLTLPLITSTTGLIDGTTDASPDLRATEAVPIMAAWSRAAATAGLSQPPGHLAGPELWDWLRDAASVLLADLADGNAASRSMVGAVPT